MSRILRSIVVSLASVLCSAGAAADSAPQGGVAPPIRFDHTQLVQYLGIDEWFMFYAYKNESYSAGELGMAAELEAYLYPVPPRPKRAPQAGALVPFPIPSLTRCPGARDGFFTPGMKFMYVANGEICAYAFDAATATATPLPGMPFKAGTFTRSIVRDRSGSALFAVNQDSNSLSVFRIEATGALTQPAGSPVATGLAPLAAAVDGLGRFVYVANNGSSTVSGFAFNRATGALTPVPGSPFAAPRRPWSIAADPTGKFVYVGADAVQAYRIDDATGALTPIGAPTAVVGFLAQGVAVDPTGRFVYVSSGSQSLSGLAAYAIGPTGALTAVGARQPTGDNPLGVTVDPTGSFVYTANLGGDASGFQINPATGALTPIVGSPFPVGGSPQAITITGVMAQTVEWVTGEYFAAPMGVAGGRLPYTWSVTGGSLPAGLALNAVTGMITGTPTTAGSFGFTVQTTDAAGATASQPYTINIAGAGPATVVTVIEYYNAAFDHYFITWIADEIAKLDAGVVIKGWTRTGKSFAALSGAQGATSPICRYYIPPAQGDSHFFGRGTAECNATGQKFPTFVLEDPAFMHMTLPVQGVCPSQTVPVYRVFSGRADANHRYMTDKALRDQMVARGWIAEGDGPDLVVMCAPGAP